MNRQVVRHDSRAKSFGTCKSVLLSVPRAGNWLKCIVG
jgi:hypothetical protein